MTKSAPRATGLITALFPLLLLTMPEIHAQGLDAPITRWDHAFSRIGGVAELPDGRVVVVDNLDGEVFRGDANGTAVQPLGATGDGPNEYRRPWSVVRGPGDTLWLYALNRLLRIAPTGDLAGTVVFAPAGGVAPPRGLDNAGRLYWDRVVIRDPRTGELKRQQQYEIVRWRPGGSQVEVVATASDHAPELHDQRFHPFAERDAWVVDPDGAVRIIRARNYAVDRVRDGRVIGSSAPIPFQPIAITVGDRTAYRRERAANPSGMSFGRRAGTTRDGATAARLLEMNRAYPDEMFPRTKPPFVEGGVLRSPGGYLWVVRSPESPALTGTRIDVLDTTGRRLREIIMPAGRRLVALDRGGVYLAAEDSDGLQFLERYRWPAGLR